MSSVVSLRDASFTYPGGASPALCNVTLDLMPGEVVAVTGPVGSGCSTLLLVAAGFAPRLTGGTLTGERAIKANRPGIVFAAPWTQLTGLCYTVAAEVAFGPASFGLGREPALAAAESAMERMGITHLRNRDPATLSGGEVQRVVVASVLAMSPDVLVLDDPAAELDPAGADALYAALAELGSGVAVMVTTPDLERVARAASRAVQLAEGRIVADGSPADVLTDTEAAVIARAAGCPKPWPLDAAALARRVLSL